ncbi:MAG: replication factor C large subunit [Candidatus Pacearchaeota archaeon]
MLTDKYKPVCFADIKGQEEAIIKIKVFLKNFPKKKAIILYGPVGVGKTSLAYVIAKEMNAEILEINASDLRDKEQIKKILGSASKQSSLFAKNKVLLVDEIDGITKDDKGGLQELLVLIDKTNFPIIITANNIWDKKFSLLREKSELIEMKEIDYKEILSLLKEITKKEKLQINEEELKVLAIKANGDIRAALNDLQTLVEGVSAIEISEREKEIPIFNIMKIIFQEVTRKDVLELFEKTDMDLDEICLWIEENIPNVYKEEELYNAFEILSKADIYNRRIIRQQYWRFMFYRNFLLSAGISASKKQGRIGFIKYNKPTRILKIWAINQKNIYKKNIAQKYAHYCHISLKTAMKEFPIIKQIILSNEKIQKELKLENEEILFLKE